MKWRTYVGEVYNSSPVIGLRGQVFVATHDGRVTALNPTDGSILWIRDLAFDRPDLRIRSSPAVSHNGDIFVVYNQGEAGTPSRKSSLVRLDPSNGAEKGEKQLSSASPDPMKPGFYKWSPAREWTLSSPKIATGVVGNGYTTSYVFVHARDLDYANHSLCVFDGYPNLLDVLPLPCKTPNNAPPLSDSVPFITDPSPALVPVAKYADRIGTLNPILTDSFGDQYRLYDWIVVVANNQCAIGAYLWGVRAADNSSTAFKELWSHDSPADVLYTSPVVTPTGEVIVGTSDGNVQSYDLVTGAPHWTPPVQLQGQIWESPSSFAGTGIFTYIATTTHLFKIRDNGTIDAEVPLPPKVRATPAGSWDRLYISSGEGLHTFAFDLTHTANAPDGASNNMFTSPTIGPDGKIYVMASDGYLVAYESGVPE